MQALSFSPASPAQAVDTACAFRTFKYFLAAIASSLSIDLHESSGFLGLLYMPVPPSYMCSVLPFGLYIVSTFLVSVLTTETFHVLSDLLVASPSTQPLIQSEYFLYFM